MLKIKYKSIISILTILLFSYSCSNEPSDDDIEGRYIKVEIENAEGMNVFLMSFENGKEVMIDSTIVPESDGGVSEFYLETKTKELRYYILVIDEKEMPLVLFLDEESEKVTLTGSMPKFAENVVISGSQPSLDAKAYMDFSYQYYLPKSTIYQELQYLPEQDTVRAFELIDQLDSLIEITQNYAANFIKSNPSSPTAWLMLREFYPTTGLEKFDKNNLDYFKIVAEAMKEKYPYSEYPTMIEQDMQGILNQIEMMENTDKQAENLSSSEVPEIVLNDFNGKAIPLSSLRGKVVLIDFWASWCGPCRMENPTVVAAYEKFKNKGFTVYSVSLDTDKEAWMKAIDADNLSWPNHVSDLQGWSSSVAALYGVKSIPASFLIDGKGNLIATNLRGPALEQKLLEVFK